MHVDSTILAALMAAIVALIVAIFSAILTIRGWREESRRLREQQLWEAEVRYLRQQIEELYGPLCGMVLQTETIYQVAKSILPNDGKKVIWHNFKDDDSNVWNFFQENYLIPVQKKMAELINSKIHLQENSKISENFQYFLTHQSVANCLYWLWKQQGKSNLCKSDSPYPEEFNREVENTLKNLITKYNYLKSDESRKIIIGTLKIRS